MPRMYLLAIPILTASTLAWNAVAQNTPGDIPDPGSYQGSMEMQRREQESAAQVQQQNEQMQQRLDQNYAAYAPQNGGGGGGRRRGAPERQTPATPGEEPLARALAADGGQTGRLRGLGRVPRWQ